MKTKVSPIFMFSFGIITFITIMIVTRNMPLEFTDDPHFWFYRVLTALAAAAISISIPGMIQIKFVPNRDENDRITSYENVANMTLLEKETGISASGAIAVFVLVYLFNPIV